MTWMLVLALLPVLLPALPARAASALPQGDPLFFKETGHTLAYNFRTYWQANGGLSILGFPISEVFIENGRPVQYFERARLEWHADKLRVLGGLLGRWAARDRQGQAAFAPVSDPKKPDFTFFPETNHTISAGFRQYWWTNGALPIFGYPLSEEFREVNPDDGKEYTVQYFERARFEYHPDLPLAYQVELGLLGRQFLQASNPAPSPEALQPVAGPGSAWDGVRPSRIKIPRLKLDTEVVEGGFSLVGWDVPRYTAVRYWPVSGLPGSPGNIAIAGHAGYRDTIFDQLPRAQAGDIVLVYTGKVERQYKVVEIITVKPSDTWVLTPTQTETLTLITCVPPGQFTERLVVRAVPVPPAQP